MPPAPRGGSIVTGSGIVTGPRLQTSVMIRPWHVAGLNVLTGRPEGSIARN
jgi:hypothetical protein